MSADKSLLRRLLEAIQAWQSVAKMKWLYRLGHITDLWEALDPESLGGPRWLVEVHDGNEDLIRCGTISEAYLRDKQNQRREAVEKARKALDILDTGGERGESLLESLGVDSSPLSDFLRHEKDRSATVALAFAAERVIRRALARQEAEQTEGTGTGSDPTEAESAAGIDEPARQQAIAKLTPAVRKAYLAYSAACLRAEKKPDELQDWEAYKLLKDEGIPEDSQGELADYRLPAKDTWCRYLGKARQALDERKHNRRRGRPHGKSIVRVNQIELPENDD